MKKPSTARATAPKPAQKYLTDDELARLFKVIESVRDRAIFRIAYHRGLRASEVAMLQMSDYRADVGRLYVHRLKCRVIDTSGEYNLCAEELRALKAWLKERGTDHGPIFQSNRGTGISQQMLDVLMKRYCTLAKIPPAKAHFHTLRHSCATHLLERGADIMQVKDWLGHVSLNSTLVYAMVTNRSRDELAKKLKGWK